MTEKTYALSTELPLEAEILFDLFDFSDAFSFFRKRGKIEVTVYSSISFEDAYKKLSDLIKVLEHLVEKGNKKLLLKEKLEFRMNELNPEEYLTLYRKYLKPVLIGNSLLIVPSAADVNPEDIDFNTRMIVLDSLLAFGTGAHPTTRMCLEYLAEADLKDKTIVDAGTGSGILAIAAARLGAKKVYALDIDAVAVAVASKNVRINAVEDVVEVHESGLHIMPELDADIIVANLTSSIIVDNYAWFRKSRANTIVVSGYLKKEKENIDKIFSRDFVRGREKTLSGWVMGEFKRG